MHLYYRIISISYYVQTGKITPVFKKGNPEEIENYIPISILSLFGTIFEKLIYSRIYGFVSFQEVLSKTQFGFRKSHAVYYSVDLITKSLKLKNHLLGIFIDLSKAFDTTSVYWNYQWVLHRCHI